METLFGFILLSFFQHTFIQNDRERFLDAVKLMFLANETLFGAGLGFCSVNLF